MLFAILGIDRPDGLPQRLALRAVHKSYYAQIADRIAFGGPLLKEDHETMMGSLTVVDFPDRTSLEEWLKDEPFTKEGVYASVTLYPFENLSKQMVGFPKA